MTSQQSGPQLRLNSPVDILAAVPYLLGFHPTDSLIVLGLLDDHMIFQSRVDLPQRQVPPTSDLDAFARYLTDLATAQRANSVILIGYGPEDLVVPAVLATGTAMTRRSIAVVESLRVTGNRYWSLGCTDPGCCPTNGQPYEVATSRVAAEATLAGRVALPDREALVATLAGPQGDDLVAIEQATDKASLRLARTTAQRLRLDSRRAYTDAARRYRDHRQLPDPGIAWLTVLLEADRQLRDLAWRRIEQEPFDETHTLLWADVLRRCAPSVAAAPAVLLGYACWRIGDGIRAGVAVQRALDCDPQYAPALLLDEILRRAVPPPAAASAERPAAGKI